MRYALEVPSVASCVAVDLNPASASTARATVEHSRLPGASSCPPVEVHVGDCNVVMASSQGNFDAIDLDPCGSPAPFLDTAVRALRSGGILCIASTEDPALDLRLCKTRYGGRCFGVFIF